LFRLTEERVHLSPVAYVVSATVSIPSSLERVHSSVRQREIRIPLASSCRFCRNRGQS
jgi:hypothetical protein